MSPARDALGPVLLAILITAAATVYGMSIFADYRDEVQHAERQKQRAAAYDRIARCRIVWERAGAAQEFRRLAANIGIKPNIESKVIPPECEASS